MDRLAAMPPGAQLAEVIERLLSSLLVPTRRDERDPARGSESAHGPASLLVPTRRDERDPARGSESAHGPGRPAGAVGVAEDPGGAAQAAMVVDVVHPAERSLMRDAHARVVDGGAGGGVDTIAAMGAEALSEVVAACHRLSSWAAWAEAVAAACLARSPEMNAGSAAWHPGGEAPPFVTDEENRFTTCSEIACRLGVSRLSAGRLLDRGQALLRPELSPTEALHRSGLLDGSKTALVIRRLDDAPIETSLAVQSRVLPRSAHRTTQQLAGDIDRALAELDPCGASTRRRRNVGQRHVTRPREAGEGVHEMRLTLPTMDAFLLDATLDAVAASARAAGDRRTTSQLRADAMTSMALRTLRGSQALACRNAGTPHDVLTAPVATGSRPTDPVPPAGPPGTDARLLPDGVPLEGLLGALSSLVGSTGPWWTPSGTQPVPLTPGLCINIDVTVPLDHLAPPLETPGHSPPGTRPSGAVHPANPPEVDDTSAARIDPVDAEPVAVRLSTQAASVTVGARTAPIPAATARALAAGGTWRRLVTDPLSGAVVDVGRTRYRPPAALRDLARARDAACTHPGCQVPAARCDLDHITPWAAGGVTSLDNLTTLCEAHHRLKHTPGWALTRTSDGALSWRTPGGARYRRDPDGTVAMLPRRIGPRQLAVPSRPVPRRLAEAIDAAVVTRLERGLAPAPCRGGAEEARGQAQELVASRCLPRGYEPAAYPQALHDLGLTPLLDEVPPF
ncbi:Uncharacterised protein [Actinomyces howellii]|uniref:HNH nuclease domain-containing protein n=1 Tax=Actinomyces howellii TaxID=52771 RepID=A0A448HDU8_9ACTO|nr:Uncharacterised protein [Actinomyces howellii]